ncbi:afadin- and alpha-actinin-binding protein [Mastacembelus armatus]|uniref:afadin- and alpha-actinin-binding protein n=1 Tax=Mastacembelus armatus TaxID=205130 RepID=UPI000E458BD8|nr:afadin- and alpha-actinin-binding protein-like [Mastacembelus armatus]
MGVNCLCCECVKMDARSGQRRVGRGQEYSGNTDYLHQAHGHVGVSYHESQFLSLVPLLPTLPVLPPTDCPLRDPSPLNQLSHSASWWPDREERRDQEESLREQLKDMDEHVVRLQEMLKCERTKCGRLQLRCNQQEAELRRREQQSNRLKERLSQLADRHRDKGPNIEVLNFPPGGRAKREPLSKSFRSTAKQEAAALRLMLERREAELREAMKLRHSLTTLLHALRVNMEQTLSNMADAQDEVQDEDKTLDQAEVALGDHVTGGVVQSWRQVQRRLGNVPPKGQSGVAVDHDKLLAEVKECQNLVRLQQELLQDSFVSPIPSELSDSYFLEEWEHLQMRVAELEHQRRTFERERKSFTDAVIRLSHERRDFEQQKGSLMKQQFLCDSPLFTKGALSCNRRESTALNFSGLGPTNISGCLPITPSSTDSRTAAVPQLHQGRVRVQTPSTPELYSALNLSYNCRAIEVNHQQETWDGGADRIVHTPHAPHLDWSF